MSQGVYLEPGFQAFAIAHHIDQTSGQLALGSFEEDDYNHISVFDMSNMQLEARVQAKLPPSKLKWYDQKILIASDQRLKFYQFKQNDVTNKLVLKKSISSDGAINSFDYHQSAKNYIGINLLNTQVTGTSLSTLCVNDINKEIIIEEVLAHRKFISDISFSSEDNKFATVSYDGSCKIHDMRKLRGNQLVYQKNNINLLNVAYDYSGVYIAMSDIVNNQIILCDVRLVKSPITIIDCHDEQITKLGWMENHDKFLISASDDGCLLMRNVNPNKDVRESQKLFQQKNGINNFCIENQFISLSLGQSCQSWDLQQLQKEYKY